jgi:hypothetical protein
MDEYFLPFRGGAAKRQRGFTCPERLPVKLQEAKTRGKWTKKVK